MHCKAADSAAQILKETLPLIISGTNQRIIQNDSQASYFHGRKAEDGLIDWNKTAADIRNLVRGVTHPYPGAFFWHNAKKYLLWEVSVVKNFIHAQAGTVISTAPLIIAAGQDAVKVEFGQPECGIYCSGAQLTIEADFVVNVDISNHKKTAGREYKKVLIIGANGFIGNAISERLLAEGKYDIYAIDLRSDGISHLLNHPDFHYFEGDIRLNHEWMEHHIRMCDIILPLAAIAVLMEYIRNPLRVFELDFEENLHIVRLCHKYNKRLVFPSTGIINYGRPKSTR